MTPPSLETLDRAGFVVVDDVIPQDRLVALRTAVESVAVTRAGSRRLLDTAWCRELARDLRSSPALARLVPRGYAAIQCILFEKSAARNWLVPLHQDLSVPVECRVVDDRLKGWSRKQDQFFVQPPDSVIASLLAVRLHLDDCGQDDGALDVVPGSHQSGRLSVGVADRVRAQHGVTRCLARAGSVLLMRPLLLHASSHGTGTSRRRVLHFLFAPAVAPLGLRWVYAV